MLILKKNQKEENLFFFKYLSILLLLLFSINCNSQKNIDICDFKKDYGTVIHFGQISKKEPKKICNTSYEKKITKYLNKSYSISSYDEKKIYQLNKDYILFEFIHSSKCGKINFIGIYNINNNNVFSTHLKYYKSNLLRYHFSETSICITKKVLFEYKNVFAPTNCEIGFYLNKKNVSFTIDDAEEFSKW